MARSTHAVLDPDGLDQLIRALWEQGYVVIGPTVRESAIVYDEVRGVGDLPAGWTDEQAPGTYRLHRRDDGAMFGYAVGPHSWKRFLFPPHLTLWRARRNEEGFEVEADLPDEVRYAFLGVRGCELAAIDVQDKVFIGDGHTDPTYQRRREEAFIVAVNCGEPSGVCFCVSMGTGPRAKRGFDLALTEVIQGDRHEFVAEAGSERGARLLATLPQRTASPEDERDRPSPARPRSSPRADSKMLMSPPPDPNQDLREACQSPCGSIGAIGPASWRPNGSVGRRGATSRVARRPATRNGIRSSRCCSTTCQMASDRRRLATIGRIPPSRK